MQPLDLDDWIEPDDQLAHYIAEKKRLSLDLDAVTFRATRVSEAAQLEVRDLIYAHLPRRFPDLYHMDGRVLHCPATGYSVDLDAVETAALASAGMFVQEDLCVLAPGDRGYELIAASVNAPSHWRLEDKIGRPLLAIHEPVPGYAATLDRSVESLFKQMKVERPFWRANWTIACNDTLFQPTRDLAELDRAAGLGAEAAGRELFIRVERQTLRRLPTTGAIVFTIRVYIDPLCSLAAHPRMAADLGRAIAGLSEDAQAYKSLDRLRGPVKAYLDSVAEGARA